MSIPISTRAVGLNESVQSIVNKINRRGLNLKVNASQFTQPLGRITQKADEFTKSLEASNARVIAFGASAAIIGGVGKTFEQLVVQAVKFEKIMTDINVVLNTTSRNLEKFGNQLFNVARNTSQALDVAAEAALEFSRQGLSMEETLKRTNDALILTRLTGMKAADAVKSLTAAVNGFADAGITTTQIINKMSAVDVKFAVSADDLANALARAGAVAQDAGVSFDQLIAAVTSAQQITARGGNVIGNSFKTIFTRIQRSSTLDQLERLGVAVRNIRGQTLPAMKVLSNLAKTYDTLSAAQKASTAEAVGGVFQINILKAGMKDLAKENSLYSQALGVSTAATDQAYKKNEQLQKTLSSLAAQTSLSIQELSKNIGELALAPGISGVLDSVNSAVQGLNDLLGKDADGLGSDVAKGFIKGFGKVLTGPGMVLALGIFGKLFFSAFKFAKQSLKDILGIVSQKDKEKKIQEAIVEAMKDNKTLASELNKYSHDKTKQEKIILGVIEEQTKVLAKQLQIAKQLAPGLARKGVKGDLTKPTAGGYIPNFNQSPNNYVKGKEREAASRGGYSPGAVKYMDIPGYGEVVYNQAEKVKRFKGMKQPAIMPPGSSRAGKEYQKAFMGSHGFDPYAGGGFMPNFAKLQGGRLTLGPSFLKLVGGPNFRNAKLDKQMQNSIKSGKPLWLEDSISKIAGGRGSHNAYLHDVLSGLSTKGVSSIGRYFHVGGKARTTRMKKKSGETSADLQERAVLGKLRKGQKGYMSTGGKGGDKTFPVDIIGRGLRPIEVKDGQIDKDDILLKSLRLYSDSELLRFASQYPDLAGSISSANQAHRGKAERLLTGKGVINKNTGTQDTEDAILSHFIASGFIPNFRRKRRGSKSQLFLTKAGTLAGNHGYMTSKNYAFLPHPGQKPEGQIRGKSIGWFDGKPDFTKFNPNATRGAARLKGKPKAPSAAIIAMHTQPGHDYEKAINSNYVTRGWTGRGPAYLDFVNTGWSKQSKGKKLKTPIGPGPKNLTQGWRYSDAHAGAGHGPRLIFNKLYQEGLIDNKDIVDAMHSGVLVAPNNFAEIVRGGKEGVFSSSSIFHPYGTSKQKRGFNMFKPGSGRSIEDLKGLSPFRISFNQDKFTNVRAGGLIPNFSNPLRDAIGREQAAGIPRSKIRIEQDNQLINRGNPFGLGITNTRDEPRGIRQGIRRARSMGVDPQSHGSHASGFYPNFIRQPGRFGQGLPGSSATPLPAVAAANNQIRSFTDKLSDWDMKLMGLTTATYFLEGAFQDAESGLGKFMGGLTGVIQGLSQGAMIGSLGFQGSAGINKWASKAPKAGLSISGMKGGAMRGIGAVSKILGPLGLLAGALPPVIGILKQFDFFKTPLEKFGEEIEKSEKKLSALSEASTAASGALEVRQKIEDLHAKNAPRNAKLRLKELQLSQEKIAKDSKLNAEILKLTSTVDVTEEQMKMLNGSLQDRQKVIAELQLAESQRVAFLNLAGGFLKGQSDKNLTPEGEWNRSSAGGIGANLKMGFGQLWHGIKQGWSQDTSIAGTRRGGSVEPYRNAERAQNLKDTEAQLRVMAVLAAQNMKSIYGGTDAQIRKDMEKRGHSSALGAFRGPMAALEEASRGGGRMSNDMQVRMARNGLGGLQNMLDQTGLSPENKARFSEMISRELSTMLGGIAPLGAKGVDDDQEGLRAMRVAREQLVHHIEAQADLAKKAGEIQARQNQLDVAIRNESLERLKAVGISTKGELVEAELSNARAKLTADYNKQKKDLERESLKETNKILKNLIFEKNLIGQDYVSDTTITGKAKDLAGMNFSMGLAGATPGLNPFAGEMVNPKQMQDAVLKYITSFSTLEEQNQKLEELKKLGVISEHASLKKIEEIQKSHERQAMHNENLNKMAKKDIDQSEKSLNRKLGTTKHHESILKELESNADLQAQINKKTEDDLTGKTKEVRGENIKRARRIKALRNSDQLSETSSALAESQVGTQMEALIKENGILSAKKRLLENTQLGEALGKDLLVNDISKLQLSTVELENKAKAAEQGGLLNELILSQHGNLMAQLNWDIKTLDAKARLYETTDALEKEVAKQLDKEEKQANLTRDREAETFGQKFKRGGFAQDAIRGKQKARETALANVQAAQGEVSFYGLQGNSLKAAEAQLQYAQALKVANEETNRGSMFWDSMRVKIAEANGRLERFAETLANTSFDAVRDSFKQMFHDLADGSKKTSDIMLSFFASIAKRIQDKLFDQAADAITSGLFEIFGGQKMHSGGIVTNYNTGGYARGDVPAMLTAGEYVVRKKAVDRIGQQNLEKMNNGESLEDLFNKPADEPFEVMGGGNFAPQSDKMDIMANTKLLSGMFKQGYVEGGKVESNNSSFERVVNNNTITKLNNGGHVQKAFQGQTSSYGKVGYGTGMGVGAALAGNMFKDRTPQAPPTPPKMTTLNTRGALNLGVKDSRLSAKYRRMDDTSQKYGSYLLEKYNYDIQQKNQKVRDRASSVAAIGSIIAGGIGRALGSKIAGSMTNSVNAARMSGSGMQVGKTPGGDTVTIHRSPKGEVYAMSGGEKMDFMSSSFDKGTGMPIQSGAAQNMTKWKIQNDIGAGANLTSKQAAQWWSHYSSSGRPGFAETFTSPNKGMTPDQAMAQRGVTAFEKGALDDRPDPGTRQRDIWEMAGFNSGGLIRGMSDGGRVHGPAGVDKVGPVMLENGEFVIKSNSVNSIEKKYPGLLDQMNGAKGYAEGGIVDSPPTVNNSESNENTSHNNVTINVNVSGGSSTERVEGSAGAGGQAMATKLKAAVLQVISEEQRVGGMLRGD